VKINFYPDREVLECMYNGCVRDVKADCVVRNELNKWRPNPDKDPRKEVIYAITEDPYNNDGKGYPVMPRTFPQGTWEVSRPRMRDDSYRAPYFIPTDAEQWLPVWELEDGGYSKPTKDYVLDIGYGIHFSASLTTTGCIRVYRKDELLWLVDMINKLLGKHEPITLSV